MDALEDAKRFILTEAVIKDTEHLRAENKRLQDLVTELQQRQHEITLKVNIQNLKVIPCDLLHEIYQTQQVWPKGALIAALHCLNWAPGKTVCSLCLFISA